MILLNGKKTLIYLFLTLATTIIAHGQGDLMDNLNRFSPNNVLIEKAVHHDKKAIRVIEKPGVRGEAMAILHEIKFQNGTIEVELSGRPRPGVDSTFRGFVGIAFRVVKSEPMQFECFYLRPTNGRSTDQLRRNHAVQYVSEPEFPWFKLRKETPGVYESYVDLVPGEWTQVKIEVKDNTAKLFVHGTEQPVLIVNDIKHPTQYGNIALWIGAGTEGHFRNLKVTPKN